MSANDPRCARAVCFHLRFARSSSYCRAFGAQPAMSRACGSRCALLLRVIEHSRLRRSARHARAFGARSRRCGLAAAFFPENIFGPPYWPAKRKNCTLSTSRELSKSESNKPNSKISKEFFFIFVKTAKSTYWLGKGGESRMNLFQKYLLSYIDSLMN